VNIGSIFWRQKQLILFWFPSNSAEQILTHLELRFTVPNNLFSRLKTVIINQLSLLMIIPLKILNWFFFSKVVFLEQKELVQGKRVFKKPSQTIKNSYVKNKKK
jgi:hypothetical protein